MLGIDPGMATLGYAVVADHGGRLELLGHGAITTSPASDSGARLTEIYDAVSGVVARFAPTEAAVERLFFSRNVTSAIAVGEARGVAILAARQRGLPVVEYTPAEVKQAVAQYGGARKAQVQVMVRLLLNLTAELRPDDASDAAAIAICHAHARATRARLGAVGQP